MARDEEQLRLLSIFHYVVAGLAVLVALLPIFYLVVMVFCLLGVSQFSADGVTLSQAALSSIRWSFYIFGFAFFCIGLVFAAFLFTTGQFLARHRRYSFCLTMAGIECIFFPFGTVLGVFTIIVLMRQSVKQLFVV